MQKTVEASLTLTGSPREILQALKGLGAAPRSWQYFGTVINSKGHIMSATTGAAAPILLTNAADPSKATRFIGFLDLVDGTALPSVTISDPTKLSVVLGAFTPGNPTATPPTDSGVPFAVYPIDAAAEASDSVTVTFSLPENPDIVLDFTISGEPPETDALDPTQSMVGPWAAAPAVPASPT